MSEMTYRPLGDSGLMVSAVGIGCNAFGRRVDLDGVRDILDAAQDVGVTLLDTADVYGGQGASEKMLGEALQGRRDDFVVATKFGMDMQGANGADHGARGSRAYVRRAVEASLRRLQVDHLDLYQYHEPDDVTPIEETLSALTDLVREGKVRYVGVSNVGGWQVADADWTARTGGFERFVSVQNRYSLLDRSAAETLFPLCLDRGVAVIAGGVFGSGVLADPEARPFYRYQPVEPDLVARVELMRESCRAHGVTLPQAALAFVTDHPAVTTAVVGARLPSEVEALLASARSTVPQELLESL